jgi:hypothetical protein
LWRVLNEVISMLLEICGKDDHSHEVNVYIHGCIVWAAHWLILQIAKAREINQEYSSDWWLCAFVRKTLTISSIKWPDIELNWVEWSGMEWNEISKLANSQNLELPVCQYSFRRESLQI